MNKTCTYCHGEIEAARLEALPETEYCIKCAKKVNPPRARERFQYTPGEEPIRQEISFD